MGRRTNQLYGRSAGAASGAGYPGFGIAGLGNLLYEISRAGIVFVMLAAHQTTSYDPYAPIAEAGNESHPIELVDRALRVHDHSANILGARKEEKARLLLQLFPHVICDAFDFVFAVFDAGLTPKTYSVAACVMPRIDPGR